MSAAAKIKWVLLSALLLLVVIIAFQNLEMVEVRILFWDGQLTKAVLLAGMAFIGFVMGLAVRPLWHMRGWRKKGKLGSAEPGSQPAK